MLIYNSVCSNAPPSASLLLRENTALLICIHRCQVGGESLLSVVVESIWCLRLHKSGSLCHFQRYFPFVVIGAYTLAKTENNFISPHKENENGQMRFSIALVISSVCVVLLTFWFSFCGVRRHSRLFQSCYLERTEGRSVEGIKHILEESCLETC